MERTTRNPRLDMAYDQSWGLLDDISSAELESERDRLDEYLKACRKAQTEASEKSDRIRSKQYVLSQVLERRHYDLTVKNLVVTDEHRKLLAAMHFKLYKDGGDYVFLGVDGKRPFGDSSFYESIAQVLRWELPNDDLSNEQVDRADQLIYELPIALNKILEVSVDKENTL